jgi:hypothetical protein
MSLAIGVRKKSPHSTLLTAISVDVVFLAANLALPVPSSLTVAYQEQKGFLKPK